MFPAMCNNFVILVTKHIGKFPSKELLGKIADCYGIPIEKIEVRRKSHYASFLSEYSNNFGK